MGPFYIYLLIALIGLSSQVRSDDASSEDTPPMVAFMCGKPAMHFRPQGEWEHDDDTDCLETPTQILNYCKQKYPELDINNVVEASKKVTIDNWCKAKRKHCTHHGSHTVRPYKCLVGPFQSDALLVPDHCVFDHFHDVSACKSFQDWNQTSQEKCHDRGMQQQSFAILLPCQTDMFAGVEFVCCPQENVADEVDDFVDQYKLGSAESSESTDSEEEEDEDWEEEDSDEYYDDEDEDDEDYLSDADEDDYYDDEDWEEEDSDEELETTTPVTTPAPAPAKLEKVPVPTDMYTEYLQGGRQNKNEHGYFSLAKSELQKHHHEKVTKMMKEWAAARQRVQEMKATDPKAADKLNREITARFQKTYQALEQEGAAEKKQLVALHQQRVQADLNEKKRHSMEHYMSALQKSKPDPSTVLKALKHYIKCEQKDRLHSINHFKHLRDTDPAEAERVREQTLSHLSIIDQRIEQSREMLNRIPVYAQKIQLQVEEYLSQFRELDTDIASLLVRTEPRLEKPAAFTPKQSAPDTPSWKPTPDTDTLSTEQMAPSTGQQDNYQAPQLVEDPAGFNPSRYDDEVMEDERAYVEIEPAHVARQGVNELALEESNYISKTPADNSMSVRTGSTLGLAGGIIAIFVVIVIGVVVLRRKVQRRPVNHGFVEVDQAASPEERHVANMQINGYENPTYKYFEMSSKA